MQERRKGARLPLEARAVFRLFDGTWHEADLIDMGQGGLRMQRDQEILAGSWLELQIIPRTREVGSIQCHGRVRWQSPRREQHLIGVQLEGSSGQIQQWLASLRAISCASSPSK